MPRQDPLFDGAPEENAPPPQEQLLPLGFSEADRVSEPGVYKAIYVHFETREAMDEFSKLIGQKVGLNTDSIWFPEMRVEHLLEEQRKRDK